MVDTSIEAIKIPSNDFFSRIEEILSENNLTLFDSNIIIPAVYRPMGKGGKIMQICDCFFQEGLRNKDISETSRQIVDFQKQYFKMLNELVLSHTNLITIEDVIEELNNYRYCSLKISRNDSQFFSKTSQHTKLIWHHYRQIKKQIANGIDSFLYNFSPSSVLKKETITRNHYYQSLFEMINMTAVQQKINSNELNTDQHLIANAFYLSTVSGQIVNILSRDDHIPQLMDFSISSVRQIIEEERAKDLDLNNFRIYIIRLKFKNDGSRLHIYEKGYR